MLYISFYKDISEYKPKLYGNISIRSAISIALGLTSVLLSAFFLVFVLDLPIELFAVLFIIIVIPWWYIGFWKWNDELYVEQLAPLLLRKIIGTKILLYSSSLFTKGFEHNGYRREIHLDKSYKRARKKGDRKAAEVRIPREVERSKTTKKRVKKGTSATQKRA